MATYSGTRTVHATLTSGQCIASVIDGATGTELARTGDLSSVLTGTGPTPLPLVRNSSTGVATPNAGLGATSPRRYFTAGTSQTAMPSSFTMSSTVTTGALTFWAALS